MAILTKSTLTTILQLATVALEDTPATEVLAVIRAVLKMDMMVPEEEEEEDHGRVATKAEEWVFWAAAQMERAGFIPVTAVREVMGLDLTMAAAAVPPEEALVVSSGQVLCANFHLLVQQMRTLAVHAALPMAWQELPSQQQIFVLQAQAVPCPARVRGLGIAMATVRERTLPAVRPC